MTDKKELRRKLKARSAALTAEYRQIADAYGTAFLAAADHVTVNAIDDEHLDADGHRKLADAVLHRLVAMQIVQPCAVRETEGSAE